MVVALSVIEFSIDTQIAYAFKLMYIINNKFSCFFSNMIAEKKHKIVTCYNSTRRNFDKPGDIVSKWSDTDSMLVTTKVTVPSNNLRNAKSN